MKANLQWAVPVMMVAASTLGVAQNLAERDKIARDKCNWRSMQSA